MTNQINELSQTIEKPVKPQIKHFINQSTSPINKFSGLSVRWISA